MHSAQSNAALFNEIQQDHTLVLENFAMATQANKTLVTLLMRKILELSSQVATLTAKLATAQSKNARLKNWYTIIPQPSTEIVNTTIRHHMIRLCTRTSMSIKGVGKNSTLTGIDQLTGTR